MPPIGLLMGGLDFSKLQWVLKPEDPTTPAVELVAVQYGAFINTVIQFLIVAVVVFLLVKLVNQVRRADAEEPAPAAPTPEEKLLIEIRDLLAKPAATVAAPKAVAAPAAKVVAKPVTTSATKVPAKPKPKT
jgi:large conductance mechanosensitive channel